MRKEGDQLHLSNEGTDPSVGSFNITAGGAARLHPQLAAPLLAYDQYLCGAGCWSRSTSSSSAGRSPPPTTRPRSAPRWGWWWPRPGPVPEREDAQRRRGAARHTFAVSGCTRASTTTSSAIDQYGKPTANFPFDGIVGGIGAFPWRDGIDHGGTMSSTMNPVGSVESMEREIPFLYLYRRECRLLRRPRALARRRRIVPAGRPPDRALHLLRRPLPERHPGGGPAGGWPATGGRCGGPTREIRDGARSGPVPGRPEELREMAPDGDPAPPKVFDNRLGRRRVRGDPEPRRRLRRPDRREPETVAPEVAGGRLLAEQAGRSTAWS